ncbi:MAG: hypothetical protein WA883_09555 [Phormidesmis sp.]
MVSPLKTWQHSEPKGLWPALGGLAVTAHVGVLGLSLPYVMQLIQPAGSPAAVVPIELIDVDSAESINSTPVESLADEASTVPTDSVPTDSSLPQNDDTAPAAASSPESQASKPKTSELETSELETSELETAPERTNPIEPPANETDSSSNPAEPSQTSTETASPPATENLPKSPQEEPLTALPGEQSLPLPEDSTGENAAAKTAYISVVDHSYVPTELLADVADTPPALDYSAVTSLSATPEDLGCGEVDFSQGQVTYRAVVSREGTLRLATPWTGSIEPQSLSASESAIACLLTAAGFSFTPAFTDGTAVANDSLLLTIDIIESQ